MNFDNKTIWITGASSGIGKGLAVMLSVFNCKLILSSRRKDELQKVKQMCRRPENVTTLPFDLADYDQMDQVVKQALNSHEKIDMLINNGGISQRSLIAETDISVDKRIMEVDYLGTVALSKALLPHFVNNQRGYFVNVSSLMGKFSSPYRSAYCAAKHALHGFFDALRLEHEKDNIKVTLVCPGFVNTDIARNALIGNGRPQLMQDRATQNGMHIKEFVNKMLDVIRQEKFEAYIGKKETFGVWLKRFFPRLLHKKMLEYAVR